MVNEKFTYENLDSTTNDVFLDHFKTSGTPGFVKCNGCLLPEYFKEFADKIKQMEIKDDDTWVCTFPKCGTTWAQEMVWCTASNADLAAAKQESLDERFPYLELTTLFDNREMLSKYPEIRLPSHLLDSFEYVNDLPSPRFIKTHLPFQLLPEKLINNSTRAKIVYVYRNPKDTCVSYYYHSKLFQEYKGSFEQFFQFFLEGNVIYGPFPNHVKGFWQRRNDPNFLLLTYEEMKKDLKSVIEKTAAFLGKSISEDDVEKLLDHLSFSSMKQNRTVNKEPVLEWLKMNKFKEDDDNTFMRKGVIGGWKELFDYDASERFDKWVKENFSEIDFTFSA